MSLNVKLQLPDCAGADESEASQDDPWICVAKQLGSVSKSQVERIVKKVEQVLATQGIPCFTCPKSTFKLYPLSGDCMEAVKEDGGRPYVIKIGMVIQCGNDHPVYRFELTMTPTKEDF